MTTVPEIVEDIVRDSPYIEQSIAENLINLSSYARKIKPQIESKLLKSVSEASVLMALKRLSYTLPTKNLNINLSNYVKDIVVRSNLMEITFANSKTLIEKHKKLLDLVSKKGNIFFTLCEGTFETTIIISSVMELDIDDLFKGEEVLMKLKSLSSISLKLTDDTIEAPGVHYSIFKLLAWEGINIRESVSTFTEISIIMDNEVVDRAFSVLRKAIV